MTEPTREQIAQLLCWQSARLHDFANVHERVRELYLKRADAIQALYAPLLSEVRAEGVAEGREQAAKDAQKWGRKHRRNLIGAAAAEEIVSAIRAGWKNG